MGNPKHRTSKSRRNMRRSHHAVKAPQLILCANCNEPKLPHRVCPNCGFYQDREIIKIEEA
ncbi:MAG: 50S ribosomal protein L32 [Candidatus Schekmanbacteria bacterium RBG_13_48_7]|uniref:Large ribosomal subunit protein bL32 n=1 Tax=Candidatus Schekmanbacteria bacterium RBG_13_48_7 TaxID=1817878 RepID=A0A1F7RW87_9BACT|nr:MAG: 50S ribosomal protein L32 [Candidatus Schekmanbacteria bacterium RBG_13_48_7]